MRLRNMELCADLLVIPATSLLGRYLELAWMMETVMECGVADRSHVQVSKTVPGIDNGVYSRLLVLSGRSTVHETDGKRDRQPSRPTIGTFRFARRQWGLLRSTSF